MMSVARAISHVKDRKRYWVPISIKSALPIAMTHKKRLPYRFAYRMVRVANCELQQNAKKRRSNEDFNGKLATFCYKVSDK